MGLLDVSASGLQSMRQALQVTANNTSNIYTEGYTRRVASFNERTVNGQGGGVEITQVLRMSDQYLVKNLRDATSSFHNTNTISTETKNLSDYVSQGSVNIAKGIELFSSDLQSSLDNPSSTASRTVLLNQLKSLTSRFGTLNTELNNQVTNVNNNLTQMTSQVSVFTKQIGTLNSKIIGSSTSDINSLLDQRDEAIRKLSELIGVTVIDNVDGSVNVNLLNGNTLVNGPQHFTMSTQVNGNNAKLSDVVLNYNGTTLNVTDFIGGGKISGLLEYRRDTLDPAFNDLGLVAVAMADQYNRQHALGMDLNGNLGGNLFNDINSSVVASNRVVPNLNNAQTSTISVAINDVSQLKASDYQLNFTSATAYSLTRLSDNTAVTSGNLTLPLPNSIAADGFTINITAGTFAANESYRITPVRNASSEIGVAVVDPRAIALAAPVRGSNGANNTGNGQISSGVVVDTSNAAFTTTAGQLTPPIRVEFLSATSYQVINATSSAILEGPITFTPGVDNAVFPTPGSLDYGYRVNISGNPVAGDQFNITYNTNGVGDNRNGLLIDDIKNNSVINNNTLTLSSSYIQFTGAISSSANIADLQSQANSVQLDLATKNRNALSGVSEDEEAINLLRYQQAFEAMSRVLQVSEQVLSAVINIGR